MISHKTLIAKKTSDEVTNIKKTTLTLAFKSFDFIVHKTERIGSTIYRHLKMIFMFLRPTYHIILSSISKTNITNGATLPISLIQSVSNSSGNLLTISFVFFDTIDKFDSILPNVFAT